MDATYSLYYMYRLHRNAMQKFFYKVSKASNQCQVMKDWFDCMCLMPCDWCTKLATAPQPNQCKTETDCD